MRQLTGATLRMVALGDGCDAAGHRPKRSKSPMMTSFPLRSRRWLGDDMFVHSRGRKGGQERMDRIVEVLDTIEVLPT